MGGVLHFSIKIYADHADKIRALSALQPGGALTISDA